MMAGSYGQDWASYQANEPDTAGLAFAFVKVTEGLTYINPRWAAQRDHAKGAGLVWGAYHYPHMANDPVAEADRFLSLVDWQPGDLIVLDWEGYDTANRGVPAAKQVAYKDAWLQHVKAKLPHNAVGTYMNVDYLTRVDTTGYHGDFLWIAVNAPAGQPGIRGQWMFHQYSSAGVDRDYCPLSAGELRTWALSFANPATPIEEDYLNSTDAQAWFGQLNAMLWGLKNDMAAAAQRDAAQTAAITQLAAAVAAVHGIDPDQLISQIKQAIADAVVKVDVTVGQNTPTQP